MVHRHSAIGTRRCRRRGFAILMVVLVLVALAIIAAPFAISMRQEEQASTHFAARVRARLAALGALNWATAQLERSHEYFEDLEARTGSPPTIFNSPQADANGEFRVDLTDPLLDPKQVANPTGVMWGATVSDEQGKVNLKTASRPFLHNLLALLLGKERGHAVADAIIQYRDVGNHQFTTLSQLREVTVSPRLTAAEYDRVAGFLTVHSAALVGDVPSATLALHPININTCTEEVLRAWLRGLKLAKQDDDEPDHPGVSDAEVETLIQRLRVFPGLAASVNQGDPNVLLDDASALPDHGWVAIEGDAVKYAGKSGSRLVVSAEPTDPLAARVDEDHPRPDVDTADAEVRLLFTDIENDLAGVLEAMVAAGELSEGSRSAILANAIDPHNAEALDLATTTAPLCFCSFNIYTIEATGLVNARDGRELARYTVRQVAQVAPVGDLEIRIDTQEEFERSIVAGQSHHVATFPNATQVSDIPPENVEVDATVLLRRGRLGLRSAEVTPAATTSFVLRVDGELRRNTLWGEEGTRMPEPDELTSVKVEPGEDGDIEPEGIHVGLHDTDGTTEKRILVYKARNDDDMAASNIPHGGEYVSPFIVETWVKFDPKEGVQKFDYSRDHFLFDLAEATFTNRVAIYYDSTGTNEGDLVLYVCDATLQKLPAQIRYHVTDETFEPQRWYHVAAVVKGIGYNQMALLINGQSVGRYEPSATLTSDLATGATSVSCDDLARYLDTRYFAPFRWPLEDCARVGGELIEHTGAGTSNLTGCTRGARGSQERRHFSGTRVEIYGYDDLLRRGSWHWNDTEYTIPHLLKAGEEPFLTRTLPAAMAAAEVDDGDEQDPPVAPTIAVDLTADGTTDYWSPAATKYQAAAELEGNAIPTEGWLPIASSEMWVVEGKDTEIADNAELFAQCAEHEKLTPFLLYNDTGQTLSTTTRTIDDATNGLGFLTVEKNQADGGEDHKGETLKYSQAGVVLVWRKIAEDDPDTEDVDEEKRACWYIGYLAGFGTETEGEGASAEGRRGCFDTEQHEIVEGATLRFDCIKLTHNRYLPRGHRETITMAYEPPGQPPQTILVGDLNGRGVFQLYRDPAYFEWVEFTFPQFQAEEDELALLGDKFLVGILRARADTVPDADAHTGREFAAGGGDKILPVFFTHNQVRVMNQYLPIVKGPGDQVTLLDIKGDRKESKVVNHGYSHMFAFRSPVTHTFLYTDNPRVLKFPSGSLPMMPDDLMFIGSDGDFDDQFDNETGETTEPAGEPERPANATFDEIKIYPAGSYRPAGLWDWTRPAGGAPESNKASRWVTFSPDTDAAPISDSLEPPFYIRVGHLEHISPKPPPPENPEDPPVFNQPFRFIANGHATWPQEGYLKIDDECMFYRTLYRNRSGHRSASVVSDRSPGADGLVVALSTADTHVYVDEQGADFPEQGYITIHNSWPNPDYWQRVQQLGGGSATLATAIAEWLGQGNPLLADGGGRMLSGHSNSYPERVFYDSKEKTTVDGKEAWKLHLAHRGILDSTPHDVRFVDEDNPPSWYIAGYTSPGSASVSVVSVELLILKRGCLATTPTRHAVGTIAMPLEHIPTSLTPRAVVKLRRELETGRLLRDPDDDHIVLALADDDPDFDIAKPEYEYGIVVEDVDGFPDEGYVQIGDEILAYAQDTDGANPVWQAKVSMWDQAQGKWLPKVVPVLTSVKHFRQRYGTARADYIDYAPGHASALKSLDPGVPDPDKSPGDPGYAIQPAPPYWDDHWRHIVHVREFRYHDRYPQVEPATPDAAPSTYVGRYAPHRDDTQLAYYEFAVTLPGTLWTRVQWCEMLYRHSGGAWQLTNDPLGDDDPFDVKLLVQIDGSPGWDDMTMDPAVEISGTPQPPQPVATPVHWRQFPDRDDAYDDDPGSHRPRKPVVFLFDEAYDPNDTAGSRPGNYINPYRSGAALQPRGQYGDRIRLRVLFQYKNNDIAAPGYDVPWRTPWVDTILINYKAPTHVMEHREMPY